MPDPYETARPEDNVTTADPGNRDVRIGGICRLESAMSVSASGYHGRYLRVDLTAGTGEVVPLPTDVLRAFIGGTGLGTWLLLAETEGRPDPFSPDAPLAFVFSPLVGSPLTTSAKFAVMAKSPLTGRLNDSLASSHFAIAGKKTGYDAIVITGACAELAVLVIEPDGIRFEAAADVRGRSAAEATTALNARLGGGFRIAAIGPAGENRVRFATISHDGRHAGRGGLGAVMGAKRLKAVAVRGDRIAPVAHPGQLVSYSRMLSEESVGRATAKYRELGTIANLATFNRLGTLPTRNFQSSTFEGAGSLEPESWAGSVVRTRDSCAACTIGCEHVFHLAAADGDEAVPVRLEYENLFALGPLCGIDDPEVVLRASSLCDDLGMDTISAGATVAFAMECAEQGLLDAPDLRFGNGEALLETLASIGERSGLGELLARGTRAAATEIGGGAEAFAPHVKGLEIPGYEPRALQTMALGFAVGSRGADHNRSGAYEVDFSERVDRLAAGPDAVAAAIDVEDEAAVMDALILCKFLRGVFDDRMAAMAEMLMLVTGWDVTAEELKRTAARLVTARKWYNIRQGWTPAEDTLPARFFAEALPDGPGAGVVLSQERLQRMIETYNRARGWSDQGWIEEGDVDLPGLTVPGATEAVGS